MTIIDVDSHFEPGPAWLDSYPELRSRLPEFDTAEVTTKIVAGDILAGVPREHWPSWEQLLPPGIAAIAGTGDKPDDYGYEGSSMHHATSARSVWRGSIERDRSRVGDLPRGNDQRPVPR